VAAVSVAAITGVNYGLREIAPAVSTGVVYLLAVLLVSSYWGLWLGLVTPKPAGSGLTKARSPKPAPQEPICGPPSGLHDRTDGRNRRNFGRGAPPSLDLHASSETTVPLSAGDWFREDRPSSSGIRT
jgi:hypothetical protein